MLPVNTNGESWDAETSNLVLQDLRSTAIADLNRRDEQLSRGRLSAANRYSPYSEKKRGDGTGSTFVVDPVLGSLRHTGEEMQTLVRARWGDFCGTPQDEKPIAERLLKRTRAERLAVMQAAGKEVQATLEPIPEADLPVMSKVTPKATGPVLRKV